MKVGDYVRTKKGVIGKYNIVKTGETIPNWNGGYGYKEIEKEYIDNNVYNRFDDEIIKSSPNIIDLIEVGDVITFGYVYTQTKEVKNIKVHKIKNEADLTLQKFYFNNKKRALKSIVTKEQFSQMEYRIEGK